MFFTFIDPHRFGVTGSLEPHRLIESDGLFVSRQHEHVKISVLIPESFHHAPTNSLTLVIRMHQHVG